MSLNAGESIGAQGVDVSLFVCGNANAFWRRAGEFSRKGVIYPSP